MKSLLVHVQSTTFYRWRWHGSQRSGDAYIHATVYKTSTEGSWKLGYRDTGQADYYLSIYSHTPIRFESLHTFFPAHQSLQCAYTQWCVQHTFVTGTRHNKNRPPLTPKPSRPNRSQGQWYSIHYCATGRQTMLTDICGYFVCISKIQLTVLLIHTHHSYRNVTHMYVHMSTVHVFYISPTTLVQIPYMSCTCPCTCTCLLHIRYMTTGTLVLPGMKSYHNWSQGSDVVTIILLKRLWLEHSTVA